MNVCGSCGNGCGEGHDYCFKCGKLIAANVKFDLGDLNYEKIVEISRKLGWHCELDDSVISFSGPGFYHWATYFNERDSFILTRSSWRIQNGIPKSQILECINNNMNAKAWQTRSYMIEWENGERSLWLASSTPVSSGVCVYELDRLIRAADEEATLLIMGSGVSEILQ